MVHAQTDKRVRRRGEELPAAWTANSDPMDYQKKGDRAVRTPVTPAPKATGKCVECGNDLWLDKDGNPYHAKGSIPKNRECPVALFDKELRTRQLVEEYMRKGFSRGEAIWRASMDVTLDPITQHDTDVRVPDRVFIDKEFIYA